MSTSPIIAIDTGKNGGFAWRDREGVACAVKMPSGMTEQVDGLRALRVELGRTASAVAEKVGTYRPGNSGPAAATFARHCGHIEAALFVLGISTEQVAPGVWMRSLGALPKDKTARKKAIKEAMQRRHPHIKVTLSTADALGILGWAEAKD
jgi:hypothetical protein